MDCEKLDSSIAVQKIALESNSGRSWESRVAFAMENRMLTSTVLATPSIEALVGWGLRLRQVLRGTSADSSIELQWQGSVIFEACSINKTWKVRFQHPLSHFQALGIMIGVLDNACLASFHQ